LTSKEKSVLGWMIEPINIFIDDDAARHFLSTPYLSEWRNLYLACPWATSGQDPQFAHIHFIHHHEKCGYAIVEQRSGDKLVGLLALARSTCNASGPIGSGDCEYCVWLCEPGRASSFMPLALQALWERTDWPAISFQYIPAHTPLDWARTGKWKRRTEIRPHTARLLPLQEREQVLRFAKSKKSLRSLSNQLNRLGTISFRKIERVEDFAQSLDTFAALYDARKLAKHGTTPFHNNSSKKAYLIDLMRVGLQHATVLELDGTIIAAHIGLKEKPGGIFPLAGITHDASYARFSPGSLLLTHLIPLLWEEGYTGFDLTPGADQYKDRWGTETRTVYELRVFPSIAYRATHVAKRFKGGLARRINCAVSSVFRLRSH
jgi:CelD/BcsL family acetyltransferase involved in cellulose biosynthesis